MPGVVQEKPGSTEQVDEQPSRSNLLPSSQNSPLSSVALPHTLTGAETHAPAPVCVLRAGEPRLHLLAVRRATAAHAVVVTRFVRIDLAVAANPDFRAHSAAPALGELHK